MISPIPKLATDIFIGTALGILRILWVFHASIMGVVLLFGGIEGLLKGHLPSAIGLIVSLILLASLFPQVSSRLGPLEKGLALFVVAIPLSWTVAAMDETSKSTLLAFLAVVSMCVFIYQVGKQLRLANT